MINLMSIFNARKKGHKKFITTLIYKDLRDHLENYDYEMSTEGTQNADVKNDSHCESK